EQFATPIPDGVTKAAGPADAEAAHAELKPGDIVAGRYKIIELLGQGGRGRVSRARRVSDMKREVALKVIKPGMDSEQVLARFKVELPALALIDHENIATVHDAGSTEAGRPFFVMELVKGRPLTDFCDEHKLSIRQRLDIFTQICSYVHEP